MKCASKQQLHLWNILIAADLMWIVLSLIKIYGSVILVAMCFAERLFHETIVDEDVQSCP